MAEIERTNRGFAIFGRIPTSRGGTIRVQESSEAGEGARVWLFLDGEQCEDHRGRHTKPDPYLSVEQAKELRAALDLFITSAEAGELMESP